MALNTDRMKLLLQTTCHIVFILPKEDGGEFNMRKSDLKKYF